MAILISGTTNDITINGASVATDAEVTSAVAPLATTEYVDGKMVLSTAITASGTAIDFTSIPSWIKRITVMFNGVSTNGSSPVQIQLGDSGGIENTGYSVSGSSIAGSVITSNYTSGFVAGQSTQGAGFMRQGLFNILKVSNNTWCCSAVLGQSDSAQTLIGGGSKTLSATLDRIRITTVNGTDVFDAGSINIMYEG